MNKIPAAGIIPYIKLNGTVYYLLGFEISNKKWSGFVGGYEPKDKNIITTAIREFNEESRMVFNNYLEFIKQKIEFTEPHIDITKTGRTVYLWFIEFPPETFNINISEIFLNNSINNPVYNEKSDIRWFNLNDIKNGKVLYNLKRVILNTLYHV